jgi:BirA family biotin operon repressor/biotin-[acetyl-CoA-carboxylase] ligase
VATNEQTEGRGRLGRTWHAPAGSSLLFSIVLEPGVSSERLPELSLVAGAAVAEALAGQANVETTVKHPNDVLIGGRKVAGILAESAERRVVLGIGVNVMQTRDELPPDADATSLALEGAHVDRAELLAAILERLEVHYDRWVSAAGT